MADRHEPTVAVFSPGDGVLPATPERVERRRATIAAQNARRRELATARAEATKQKPQDEAVERAVIIQLGLRLRGLRARDSVLAKATGVAAELRDLLDANAGEQAVRLRGLVVDWKDAKPERVELLARISVERDDNAEALARDAFARVPATPVLAVIESPKTTQKRGGYAVHFVSVEYSGKQAEERVALHAFTPKWRQSDAGYHKRVERKLLQVKTELAAGGSAFVVDVLPEDAWQRQAARWRKRKQRGAGDEPVRYVVLPQADNTVVVIHDSQRDALATARPLPTDDAELRTLLHGLLATPDGKKTDTSPGFGGSYMNQRGDGRVAQAKQEGARVVVGTLTATGAGGIGAAADALGTKLGRKQSAEVTIEWFDAYQRLLDIGHELRPAKDKHEGTLVELLATYEATKQTGVEQTDRSADEQQDMSRVSDNTNTVLLSLRRDIAHAPLPLALLDMDDEDPPDRRPALLVVSEVVL